MKDLMDKLSDSIKQTCKEVGAQTQESISDAKLMTEITRLKAELKKYYQKLGELYYAKNEDNAKQLQAICNKITQILELIKQCEAQLNDNVNKQKDSFNAYKRSMHTAWHDDDEATKTTVINEEGIEVLKFCSKCGCGNSPSALHCTSCGMVFK